MAACGEDPFSQPGKTVGTKMRFDRFQEVGACCISTRVLFHRTGVATLKALCQVTPEAFGNFRIKTFLQTAA